MKNPVIEIKNAEEFDDLLNSPDKVLFVVLGNSAKHEELIKKAGDMSDHWRFTAWTQNPTVLYPRLLSLKLRPGVLEILAPWPPQILAVSISVNNYICRVLTKSEGNVVAPAFMLAETFMQP
jgi:hypothetical protein